MKLVSKSSTELDQLLRSFFPPLGHALVALTLNSPGLHLLQPSLLRDNFLVGCGLVVSLQERVGD